MPLSSWSRTTTMSIPRSDQLRVPHDAATPFHASAYGANIVLRTMDSVDFHVSTAIMASHSVFFEHLFSDASDSSGDSLNNGRPVIPLQDSSQDIRALLLLFYPGVSPESRSFESANDAFRVYAVAEKYCMHQCVFEAFEHAVLSSDAFSVHDPVAQYCLGVRAGSKALLRDAAYKCLDFPLSSLLRNLGLYSHLGFLKQSHVMTLWAYHEECGTKAAGILHPRSIHYSSWLDPSRNIQHPWVRRNPYCLSTSNTIAFMSCQFLSEIHYMHD